MIPKVQVQPASSYNNLPLLLYLKVDYFIYTFENSTSFSKLIFNFEYYCYETDKNMLLNLLFYEN